MPNDTQSFLAGRNKQPLSEKEVARVITAFSGFERDINAHYDADSPTLFRVKTDEFEIEYGDVTFGPDIFPGQGVVDSNSALSFTAAVAHEVSHYHRWKNKCQIDEAYLSDIDEALTSLEAIRMFSGMLNPSDIQGLTADAIQRIVIYVSKLKDAC